jgi:hypothetical protein
MRWDKFLILRVFSCDAHLAQLCTPSPLFLPLFLSIFPLLFLFSPTSLSTSQFTLLSPSPHLVFFPFPPSLIFPPFLLIVFLSFWPLFSPCRFLLRDDASGAASSIYAYERKCEPRPSSKNTIWDVLRCIQSNESGPCTFGMQDDTSGAASSDWARCETMEAK